MTSALGHSASASFVCPSTVFAKHLLPRCHLCDFCLSQPSHFHRFYSSPRTPALRIESSLVENKPRSYRFCPKSRGCQTTVGFRDSRETQFSDLRAPRPRKQIRAVNQVSRGPLLPATVGRHFAKDIRGTQDPFKTQFRESLYLKLCRL